MSTGFDALPATPVGAGAGVTPSSLAAGAMDYLAVFVASGCPRAAHRARLLLARLSSDEDTEPRVRDGASKLCDAMEAHLESREGNGRA